MHQEIVSAANFLVYMARVQTSTLKICLADAKLEMFRKSVIDVLEARYQGHWFPDQKQRGSGYRCLRISGKMDHWLDEAAALANISPAVLQAILPAELTVWIDPCEVNYRIGENGSICPLYEGNGKPAEFKALPPAVKAHSFRGYNTKSDVSKSGLLDWGDHSSCKPPGASNNSCKDYLHQVDSYLDWGVGPFEQLPQYVSS